LAQKIDRIFLWFFGWGATLGSILVFVASPIFSASPSSLIFGLSFLISIFKHTRANLKPTGAAIVILYIEHLSYILVSILKT